MESRIQNFLGFPNMGQAMIDTEWIGQWRDPREGPRGGGGGGQDPAL